MIQLTMTDVAKWYWAKVFRCPECSGSHFGTANCTNWDNAVGHCHDEYGVGCNFEWPRSDDEKYFVPKAVAPQTTAEKGHEDE